MADRPRPGPVVDVLANCATSLDGKLATRRRRQVRLSGDKDMARVHRLRARADAICVGIGTLLADDPKLTAKARHVDGEPDQPLKVILDSTGRTPPDCEAIATPGPVLVATAEGHDDPIDGAEVRAFGKERVDLEMLLDHLDERGIEELLVEGGGEVLWSFLSRDLVDELTVYIAPVVLGGTEAPTLADGDGFDGIEEATRMELADVERVDDGVVLRYRG